MNRKKRAHTNKKKRNRREGGIEPLGRQPATDLKSVPSASQDHHGISSRVPGFERPQASPVHHFLPKISLDLRLFLLVKSGDAEAVEFCRIYRSQICLLGGRSPEKGQVWGEVHLHRPGIDTNAEVQNRRIHASCLGDEDDGIAPQVRKGMPDSCCRRYNQRCPLSHKR
jgi:hypothetical protein